MVDRKGSVFVDYFDGVAQLDSLLNPPKLMPKFVVLVENTVPRVIDEADKKFVGFLQGKKVFFTPEEVEKYILYWPTPFK